MEIIAKITLFIAVITVLVNSLLAITVYFKGKIKEIKEAFILLLVVISLWGLVSSISLQQIGEELQLLFCRLDFTFGALGGLVFVNFTFKYAKISYKSLFLTIFALFSFFWVYSALFTNLIVAGIKSTNIGFVFYSGVLDIPYAIFLIILIIIGVLALFVEYKRSIPETKLQNQYLLIGSSIPALIIIISMLVLERIFNNNMGLSNITKILLPAMGYTSIFIFSMISTYALLKQRLFGIRIILSKIMYWVILCIFFGLIFTTFWFFVQIQIPNLRVITILIYTVLTPILFEVYFQKIWPPLKKYITKVFWEEDEIIKTYNSDLSQITELLQVNQLLFTTINKLFNPNKQLILLYDQEFNPDFNINSEGFKQLEIKAVTSEKIVNCLSNLPKDITEVSTIQIIQDMNIGINYVYKINYEEQSGFYILGNKVNNQRYPQNELDLVNKLIFYTSLAMFRLGW